MNWWNNVVNWAKIAWNGLTGGVGAVGGGFESIWHFITSVASAVDYMIRNPMTAIVNSLAVVAGLITGNMKAARAAAARAIGFVYHTQVNPLRKLLLRMINELHATMLHLLEWLQTYLMVRIVAARHYAHRLFLVERAHRIRDFKRSEAYTRQQIKYALALVQKEAASGYKLTLQQRVSLIQRVADAIVTRNPLLKDVLGKIISGLLDLLAIDNPVARLVIGFLINHVVDHLGIDKAMGELLRELAGPILGNPAPNNLHDVVANMGDRLDALENQWGQFMADGGPEILQAGSEWRDITGVLADAGLLALFATMVATPDGFAAELAAAGQPIVSRSVAGVADVFRAIG